MNYKKSQSLPSVYHYRYHYFDPIQTRRLKKKNATIYIINGNKAEKESFRVMSRILQSYRHDQSYRDISLSFSSFYIIPLYYYKLYYLNIK